MSNGNELQKDEMYLPGSLGTIRIGNQIREVKSIFSGKDGSVTITIAATEPKALIVGGNKTGLSFYSPEKTIKVLK